MPMYTLQVLFPWSALLVAAALCR
ncbi:uncharacterized protein METZ01_LOCUS104865 [marine metagenome]|uniref:Uncharacterized protein n=1 Tax=marine metagenome TaxID=408172 RepID=A0A381WI85_9ZZZZ